MKKVEKVKEQTTEEKLGKFLEAMFCGAAQAQSITIGELTLLCNRAGFQVDISIVPIEEVVLD